MAAVKTAEGMRWLCDWCFRPLPVRFETTWVGVGVKLYHSDGCWDASADPHSEPPRPVCANCGRALWDHCKAHLIPCCLEKCPVQGEQA